MTRSNSLLAAAGVGLSALLVAAPAKAFIVFAPAAVYTSAGGANG